MYARKRNIRPRAQVNRSHDLCFFSPPTLPFSLLSASACGGVVTSLTSVHSRQWRTNEWRHSSIGKCIKNKHVIGHGSETKPVINRTGVYFDDRFGITDLFIFDYLSVKNVQHSRVLASQLYDVAHFLSQM